VLEWFACGIVQLYGMTEATPTVSYQTGDSHRAAFERPVMGTALRKDELPVGEVQTGHEMTECL
jgi:acyl-CoA synthetase (AMP-forming)/AMP-acid ligase II